MSGLILTDHNLISALIQQPGMMLFGLTLILFGSALTMVFLLKTCPHLSSPMIAILSVLFASLLGILAFDLSGTGGRLYTFGAISDLSELLSTHRWLLIQVPLVLIPVGIINLLVYQEKIAKKFAKEYHASVLVCVIVSFLTLLVIGAESMM